MVSIQRHARCLHIHTAVVFKPYKLLPRSTSHNRLTTSHVVTTPSLNQHSYCTSRPCRISNPNHTTMLDSCLLPSLVVAELKWSMTKIRFVSACCAYMSHKSKPVIVSSYSGEGRGWKYGRIDRLLRITRRDTCINKRCYNNNEMGGDVIWCIFGTKLLSSRQGRGQESASLERSMIQEL
jgi:hypothetical protein